MPPKQIRDDRPKARMNHRCDLCLVVIPRGQRHLATTLVHDGVYTFRTCPACEDDAILGWVHNWMVYDEEGVDYEAAHEWATDTVEGANNSDEYKVAQRFLHRWNMRGGST